MATGRNNTLVGQTGEYLVAAELSRRGLIATTFTRNVPHYDIVASDKRGRHVAIQVKSSRKPSWQFKDASHFFDIRLKGHKQIVGKNKLCPVKRLMVVFVRIDETLGRRHDRFYICKWTTLRRIVRREYIGWLRQHHGRRPKTWDSRHSAIEEELLLPFEVKGRWPTITGALK